MAKYVMKFGGTSLKDAETIKKASSLISDFYKKNKPDQLIVVVSAPGKVNDTYSGAKVTDLLERYVRDEKPTENIEEVISRTDRICKELEIEQNFILRNYLKYEPKKNTDKNYSYIVSAGERMQSLAIGLYLIKIGLPALPFDNNFGMLTKGEYKNAEASEESTALIEKNLSKREGILVVPGFVGWNEKGEITTLGRDGSNYTATKVAEAIQAKEVYIFSDEPGVRRAPPRLIPDSEVLEEITYDEAIEFAELGAKIINAKSVYPAKKENIPINIVDENYKGTRITSHISSEHLGAKIIASSPNHFLLTVKYDTDKPGVLADIADKFKKAKMNIESIADERHALTLAFIDNGGEIGSVLASLSKEYKYTLENSFARISLIGQGMRNQPGILAKMTGSFARRGISIDSISQSLNQLNITAFIPQEYERTAVKSLYDDLFRNWK